MRTFWVYCLPPSSTYWSTSPTSPWWRQRNSSTHRPWLWYGFLVNLALIHKYISLTKTIENLCVLVCLLIKVPLGYIPLISMETSSMTVKGCKMKIYAWYLRPLRREGSLPCHTNLFHVASVFCGLIRRTYPILFPIRRYMAEILPIRRNTQPNQSIKWSPIAMSKGYLERIRIEFYKVFVTYL